MFPLFNRMCFQRLLVKISGLIRAREEPSRPADIFDLLFARERRPSAKDSWFQANSDVAGQLEREEMVRMGWKPEMGRQETFPIQSRARKAAFARLPEDEKEHWRQVARDWVPTEPSK